MRGTRRAGVLLLAAGALAAVALHLLWPLPGSAQEFAEGNARSALVGAPSLAHYDEPNDTTLAAFGWCDHQPCGDAFAFRGDARQGLAHGPHELVFRKGEPRSSAADEDLNTRTGTRPPYGDPSRAAGARVWSPEVEMRSPWPTFFAHAVAASLLFAGAALAAGASRSSALPPISLMTAAIAIPAGGHILAILVAIGLAILAFLGGALAFGMKRRALAAALALSAVGLVAGIWLGVAFIPQGAGEI